MKHRSEFVAKGISPSSAVRSASGFLCKAAGGLMSKLLGSPPAGQAALGESSGTARHSAFQQCCGLRGVPNIQQHRKKHRELCQVPGLGHTSPFGPLLLKKTHQGSNWKWNKCGGLAWFRLEIRAVTSQRGAPALAHQ